MTPTLSTRGLSKQWGAFKANSDITLSFAPGARHALITGFTCSHTPHCSPLLSKKKSSSISPRFTMLATISQ